MNCVNLKNLCNTKQGSANTVWAYAELVLHKKILSGEYNFRDNSNLSKVSARLENMHSIFAIWRKMQVMHSHSVTKFVVFSLIDLMMLIRK